jgi:hypothetical protein
MTAPTVAEIAGKRTGVLAFIERRLAGGVVPAIAFGWIVRHYGLPWDVAVAAVIVWANATTRPAQWLINERQERRAHLEEQAR